MLGLWNIGWLNQNSQRAYPIAEHGTRVSSVSSAIQIPDDFLLAMKLSVNTGHNVSIEKFFVKAVTVTGNGCAILIGYNDGSHEDPEDYPSVGTTYVVTGASQLIYTLTGLDDFEDITGYIAVNTSCDWLKTVTGYFTFLPDATPVEPDCVVPMLRSISSIAVSDGYTTGERYYGDVVLSAGTNVELEVQENTSNVHITIHAVTSDDFEADCSCDIHEEAPCIRTLNSVHPDTQGNILLEGISCVSLENGEHSITFKDTCASPRCECSALQDLGKEIRDLEDGVATLSNFINQMQISVEQTKAVIDASNII